MLRHLDRIVICACIVASVGCTDGGPPIGPAPLPSPPPPPAPVADSNTTVRVEFGGRVINADAGGPIANVWVSVGSMSLPTGERHTLPKDAAVSGGDGTFTLPVNLPSSWRSVHLHLTGLAGYDDRSWRVVPTTAADRPAIRIYPTLVIRPGESIEVHVDRDVVWCGFGPAIPCRRVLVAASPGDPVELEIVPHDTTKPMGLGEDEWVESPERRRLLVAPGGYTYVTGPGTATLTARR